MAGMNCTAWNSVCANALTNRPSAVPRTAFATASAATTARGPCTSRPSAPKVSAETTPAWRAATSANAAP